MESHYRKQALLQKYLDGKCSRPELEELFDYLKSDDDEAYQPIMEDLWKTIGAEKVLKAENADRLLAQTIQTDRRVVHPSRRWYRIAAAVLALVAGVGCIYVLMNKKNPVRAIVQNTTIVGQNDIKPGSVKAVLQAGGVQVTLNKKDTSFSLAGNMVQVKNGNVEVTDARATQYTLIVPRGGAYNLTLSDGTKVWLNADSKLIYPSKFTGENRAVSLEGEAYFKVGKDAEHPFIVHTEKQDIQVLGTEFNIHAYANENESVTTLINGAVRVNSFGEKIILVPGQQVISGDGKATLQEHPDIKQAIAWKEGYFIFHNTGLQEVMQQLSRWYDVTVNYEKGVRSHEFMAIISRDNNISQVLGMLEASGVVRFKVKGKEVTVMKGVK